MTDAGDLALVGRGDTFHATLAAARATAPVVWSATHRSWIVLTHQHVAEGFRDPRLSSDRTAAFERLAHTRPAAFRAVVDVLSGWMVFRDPPGHDRLRQPVRAAFTPRRIAALESTIRQIAEDLLDAIDAGDNEEVDLRQAMAVPLPAIVIAELLGVPASDREMFQRWSNQLAGIVFAASSAQADDESAIAGAMAFAGYFGDLAEHYRAHPGDNLVSAIVAAADAGGSTALQPSEVVGACAMLLFAGHETTTTLLSNALWTLFEHPDERARWQSDPRLDETAVDELVRFEGPATVMIRRAVDDFGWAGVDIRAGDAVYLCMAAANRDPMAFREPDRLDLERDPNPHLGFGWGIHHCLGAPLARLETRVALRRVFDRFPRMEPVGAAHWGGGVIGRSAGPVPIRLRPDAKIG
jgi:cytochrome P450